MAEIITHTFVSAKSDSPDTTLVSASEWNAGHLFGGGTNGAILMYDNTQPGNIRWTEGVRKQTSQHYIVTSTPTPIINLAPMNFTTTYSAIGTLILLILNYTSVGAAVSAVIVRHNDSNTGTLNVPSGTAELTLTTDIAFPPGTHVIDIDVTVAGNANILTLSLISRLIFWGV